MNERNQPGIYAARMELFKATPPKVWREYFDNGYTWAKAVDEELSYAETENYGMANTRPIEAAR